MITRWTRTGILATVLAAVGFITSCQTVETTAPGAVGVDRKQQMLVSSEQVDQAAAQAYAQELADRRAHV